MKKIIFAISILVLLLNICGTAYSDLDALIDVARGQADMQRVYHEETKAYECVKRAFNTGAIAKGISKSKIQDRYGQPVVNYIDSERKKERWVYKPASSSFFSGERINLFFDDKGVLDEIEFREK